MYLKHFSIHEYPFTLTPNTAFYCDLPTHQAALNVLLFSLRSGEGFIKITGDVGTGKTLLCRKLLNALDDEFVTAYIPSPDLDPLELRKTFAVELGLDIPSDVTQSQLLRLLSEALFAFRQQDKKVVLIVDESQALSDESLETLRLLTNLETESEKLLQIVLFGQPELDARLNQYHLRQINQRITFAYRLLPLSYEDLVTYLNHRMFKAGYTQAPLFERGAVDLLLYSSAGIPRVVNILCHKAMLVAYGKGEKRIKRHAMWRAVQDSRDFVKRACWSFRKWLFFLGVITVLLFLGLAYEYAGYLF